MTVRQLAPLDHTEHVFGKLEQPDPVGDGRLRAAHALADLAQREPELVDQQRVGTCLLDRRELLPSDVLDDAEQERVAVVGLPNERRDGRRAGLPCRAPAPLTGDQLEGSALTAERADQQGLDDALFADRLGERIELGLVKTPPRLEGAGANQLDRHAALRRRIGGRAAVGLAKQGCEATAEVATPGALAHCGAPRGEAIEGSAAPLRRNTSVASRI